VWWKFSAEEGTSIEKPKKVFESNSRDVSADISPAECSDDPASSPVKGSFNKKFVALATALGLGTLGAAGYYITRDKPEPASDKFGSMWDKVTESGLSKSVIAAVSLPVLAVTGLASWYFFRKRGSNPIPSKKSENGESLEAAKVAAAAEEQKNEESDIVQKAVEKIEQEPEAAESGESLEAAKAAAPAEENTPAPEIRKRGRSPAPVIEKRGRSPAPVIEKRCRSPVPVIEKRGCSPAPVIEKRGRSPAPVIEKRGRSHGNPQTMPKKSQSAIRDLPRKSQSAIPHQCNSCNGEGYIARGDVTFKIQRGKRFYDPPPSQRLAQIKNFTWRDPCNKCRIAKIVRCDYCKKIGGIRKSGGVCPKCYGYATVLKFTRKVDKYRFLCPKNTKKAKLLYKCRGGNLWGCRICNKGKVNFIQRTSIKLQLTDFPEEMRKEKMVWSNWDTWSMPRKVAVVSAVVVAVICTGGLIVLACCEGGGGCGGTGGSTGGGTFNPQLGGLAGGFGGGGGGTGTEITEQVTGLIQ